MSYRPFRSIGRYLLAACAVSLGAASLSAQTTPSTTAPNPSRMDIFAGYSYFGAHGTVQPAGYKYSSVDEGAIGSFAYYFNKYAGAEVVTIINPNGHNDLPCADAELHAVRACSGWRRSPRRAEHAWRRI
jgi:hypothetical protein